MAESRPEWDACRKADLELAKAIGLDTETHEIWTARLPIPKDMLVGVDMDKLNRELSNLLTTNADKIIEECRAKTVLQ